MRLQHLLCLGVVVASIWPSSQQGQEAATGLRIKLNAIDGTPINGTLVALLDAKDSVVAEGVAGEAGALDISHSFQLPYRLGTSPRGHG